MDVTRLVRMANDIGAYFATYPDHAEAVGQVAHHIRTRWAPPMRRQIIDHLAHDGAGLSDIAREAIATLAAQEKLRTASGGAREKQTR